VFTAGLLTFVSPCVLPMAPIIVAQFLVSGRDSKFARLKSSLYFALGFMLTFTVMGVSLPLLSSALGSSKRLLLIFSGIVILLYGLKMSGFDFYGFQKSRLATWFTGTFHFPDVARWFPKSMHGFVFGATFGLTWTPCVGPILGGVLAYVATKDRSAAESVLLMCSFASGIVLPFLILSFGGDLVQARLQRFKVYLPKIEEFTGTALLVVGVMILTQASYPLEFWSERRPGQIVFRPSVGDRTTLSQLSAGAHQLLFFYTDTCPVCHAVDAYLPEVEKQCSNAFFRVVRINVGLPENDAIARAFEVRAVPTMSLISPDGQELAHTVGYVSETKLRQAIRLLGPQMACAAPST